MVLSAAALGAAVDADLWGGCDSPLVVLGWIFQGRQPWRTRNFVGQEVVVQLGAGRECLADRVMAVVRGPPGRGCRRCCGRGCMGWLCHLVGRARQLLLDGRSWRTSDFAMRGVALPGESARVVAVVCGPPGRGSERRRGRGRAGAAVVVGRACQVAFARRDGGVAGK